MEHNTETAVTWTVAMIFEAAPRAGGGRKGRWFTSCMSSWGTWLVVVSLDGVWREEVGEMAAPSWCGACSLDEGWGGLVWGLVTAKGSPHLRIRSAPAAHRQSAIIT